MVSKPAQNSILIILLFFTNLAVMAQTNPIVDLVNDTNNNVDGNVSNCANDGSQLPRIFLCGINDTANLTVSYPTAVGISWQKLDENSCTNFGDDCANKSPSCVYNTVASGSTYPVNNAGKYRLRIDRGSGVFESHYFHVYQNTLEVLYQTADIGCEPTGNITITNLGSNYGFRLVNASNDEILVPFSANNGPSFVISTDGNYRVETIQLNPFSGLPVENGCLFSTPEIAIGTSTFAVQASSTEADCTGVGTVSVTATNGTPNYAFELRLDDGLDGGRGTLIDVVTNQTSNTYTFTGVGQGDYLLVGRNSSGCEQSAPTTVIVDSENTLGFEARVSQHITCREGNILVDPDGGKPPYRYAIWKYVDESDNVITTYNSPSDIPSSEFQTSEIFDIFTPGNYSFVLIDRFGCFTISNSVDIEFVPPATFDDITETDVACFGEGSGSLQMNLIEDGGYRLTYYLFDTVISEQNIFDGNFNLADAIASNSSGFFPGLMAGDYTIVVNMQKGNSSCNYPYYATVETPPSSLAGEAILIQPFTCTQTGTIRANNYGGGTAPYEFSLNGANWQTNDMFIGLQPGTYTIFIRDFSGCVIETNEVEIVPVNEPEDLIFTSSQITCDDTTSDVTVTIVGGTSDFVIQITTPSVQNATSISNNIAVFEDLAPGTYTFSVADSNDCTYEESFTILPISEIAVVGELLENVSCNGFSDGALRYTVNGFDTTYSYAIVNGSGTTVNTGNAVTNNVISLDNQPGETYIITVTDDITACTATTSITIAAPVTPLTATIEVTDISCSATGTNPGSVSITAAGGWGSYEYQLQDPTGAIVGPQTSSLFAGLTDISGTYTVTVQDMGGCEVQQTFLLSPTVSPVLEVTANSLCYDSTTGLSLTATVISGGVAPFQYRIAGGGAYQSNPIFSGLAPGSYTIEVIDSKNCTANDSIEVFPTLTASANLVKDLDCSPTPEAEISITIVGGNPTFTYEVFRDGTSVQSNTAVPSIPFSYFTAVAGNYEFTITDIESCTVTTNQVTVTANSAPTTVEVITEPLCSTSADGIAALQIIGGTPPYLIVFNGSAPSTQTTYPGLVAGTYNYTVTDSKGCLIIDEVTLTAPDPLLPGTINITQDYSCDSASATLQIIGYSGGTPTYTFSIDGVNFQTSDTFSTGISAGTYVITIRDSNGCVEQTPAVIIDPLNPPTDLVFGQTSPVCPAVVADVTVTVIDGNTPFIYEIISPSASAVNNGNDNIFTGLIPGTYTFLVTDSKGCTLEESYTVVDIPRVAVLAQLTSNVSCFGLSDGEFNFTVSDFATTYTYVVENSSSTIVQSQGNINLTTPITIPNLVADTYTVIITDDTTNCSATTVTTISGPPAALDFSFTNTPVTCTSNATITVTPTGGWGSYEYQLENTTGPVVVYAYQRNAIFSNVAAGTYTIYVRDSGGCIVDRPITIEPAQAPTIALDVTSDYCYDNTNQASFVINVTDGVAPYSYRINGGGAITAIGNPFTISNLIPGSYSIQVIDAFGCVSNILNETINPQLIASSIVTKALDCSIAPDAIIEVSVSNGYTPYATYEVSSNGGTTWGTPVSLVGSNFSYTTATAGTYDFRITDNRNCSVITQAIVPPISNPVITSLVQTTDILCNGNSGGTIQVNLDTTQGVAPFTISVINTTTVINYGAQTSGLPAGTYEVTVTDANSCTDTDVVVITEPDVIDFTINLTDIQCDSAGTDPTDNTIPGSISVSAVTGGTAEYVYYLNANNGMPTQIYATTPGNRDHTFTILNFGIYNVEIIDANGCSVTSSEIIASPPDDLDIDVSTATANCALGGEAIVTVSSAFSSNDYEFAVLEYYSPPYSNNYQGPDVLNGDSATITGLIPGVTYTFVVFDNATKCYYFESAGAPIDTPSNLSSTLDMVSNVSCTGNADGAVSFTFANYDSGATAVSYEIFNAQSNVSTGISDSGVTVNPPAPSTGVQISNVGPLPPGVYYILFTEQGGAYPGCSVASEQFTIEEASVQLVANANLVKNDNCNPNAGQVSASGQFGRAPYEFQLALNTDTPPTTTTWTGTSNNFFNVEGGDYIIYVKDAFGCIEPASILVPTDPEPEISVVVTDECTALEGAFSVNISLDVAGIAPYSIRVDGGTPQATSFNTAGDIMTVLNLSSGLHSIEILDQNGCGETETFTIYPPLAIFENITVSENCDPANSGEVTVSANGGSGNYSFSQISPVGATNIDGIFTGLTHSVAYTFEVTDTITNCQEQVSITLPAPAIPTFIVSRSNVSCFGGNDGTITVNLESGNIDIPYEYSLDGGITRQPSNIFNGLTQGTYNVTVISAKGCEDTQSISIDEPTQLVISASASPFSCDAIASTITVNVINDGTGNPSGSEPYVYSFDNGANFQSANTYQVPFGSPDVNIVVKDANGCLDTEVVVIPLREEVTASISNDGPIDCTDNEQVISINATGGSGTYTYTELPNGTLVVDPTTITLTQPGTYIYEVLDTITNCSFIVEHEVAPYNLIEVTASVSTDATCSDSVNGVIEVTVSGYTGTFDYEVLDATGTVITGTSGSENATSDPYTFNVSTTLGAGIYSVQIVQTAFPECDGTSNQVTIDAPEPLTLQLVSNVNANCNAVNAIVLVQATGGTAPYSYGASLRGAGDSGVYPFDNTVELDPNTGLDWDIYVQDANNCIVSVPLEITIDADTIPNIALAIDDECAAEGSFDIVVSLDAVNVGIPPYTMSLDGNAFESIASFPHTYSNQSAGLHTVVIRDANGCGEAEDITIISELLISAIIVSQPTCGTNDGVIEFNVLGGDTSNAVSLLIAGTMTDTGLSPTGNQFIGVGFGDYIVRVIDTPLSPASCFADAPVSLEEPTPVTLLVTGWTDVTCTGASDGTITINMEPSSVGINDNPIYIYTIENITTGSALVNQDNPVFTNLNPGIYDITVTSGRNCIATDQIEIVEPTPLLADNPMVNPFTCDVNNAVNVATIDVSNISGGTANYFYTVDGVNYFSITGNAFNHAVTVAGDYTLIIRDANGCELPLPTVTVEPLPVISLGVTEGPADCQTGQQIIVASTGHSTPIDLTFEVLETGDVQANLATNTTTFNLMSPGAYTIKVTDNGTGCYEFIEHSIDPRPEWDVALTVATPVTCFGDNNGTLEVTFTDYTGSYNYEVFNEDGTTTGMSNTNVTSHPLLISNLPAGNYFVEVLPTEYPYCEKDETLVVTVESPNEPLIAVVEALLAAGCPNDMGEISVVPNGGYAPYDISLTHSSGQVYPAANGVFAYVFTALQSGDYIIEVIDAQGCLVTYTETIDATPVIVATATSTPPVCYDDPDGSIIVNALGGSMSYNYFINYYDETGTSIEFTPSTPQRSNEFNFLGEGYYSVTVTDNMGCSDTTDIIFIDGPDQLLAEVRLTTAMTCESPAMVTASGSGGTAPYTYQLEDNTGTIVTPFQTNNTFSVVAAGTYRVRIVDANNCEILGQVPVVVPEIPPVQLNIDFASTSVSCADDTTASIYASAIGGIGQYTFDLLLGGAVVSTQMDFREAIFENLLPGNYTVRVTSEGGCNPDEELVPIANPAPLIFNREVTPETCVNNLDGSITLMLSGGGGGYQFAISPKLNQFFDEDPEQGLPAGQYRFEDLAPGNYTVIAQDANGCFYIEELIIEPASQVVLTAETTPETCEGDTDGSITLDISGGTAPYKTRLMSEATFVQDRLFFSDLAAGSYIVFVEDANGCQANLNVNIDSGVNLNATLVPIYECVGNSPENYINITFEDASIMGEVLYALDSDDPNDLQLSPDFRNISPGPHYVRIVHSGGCTRDILFEIQAFEPLTLLLEQNNLNEITAVVEGGLPAYTYYFDSINNGNDNTFRINRSGNYVVRVVDENGCEVIATIVMEFIDIEIPNFFTPDGDGQNDFWLPKNIDGWPEIWIKIYDRYGRVVEEDVVSRNGWDGRYNQNELPTGDYWYIIRLNGENDEREFVGHFTLYR